MKSKTPLSNLLNKLKQDANAVSRTGISGNALWLYKSALVVGATLLFSLGMLFGGGGGGYATYEGDSKDSE